MKITTVSVEFKKTVNDGNYGNEGAQVHLSVDLDESEDSNGIVTSLQAVARSLVLDQLAHSGSVNVRRNANPRPHVCSRCGEPLGDWDNYTHQACDEKDRAERDARRQARPTGQNGEDIEAEQDLGEPDAPDIPF